MDYLANGVFRRLPFSKISAVRKQSPKVVAIALRVAFYGGSDLGIGQLSVAVIRRLKIVTKASSPGVHLVEDRCARHANYPLPQRSAGPV